MSHPRSEITNKAMEGLANHLVAMQDKYELTDTELLNILATALNGITREAVFKERE